MYAEKEIIIHYENLFKKTIDQASNQPTTQCRSIPYHLNTSNHHIIASILPQCLHL